jgi:hypothetical protein
LDLPPLLTLAGSPLDGESKRGKAEMELSRWNSGTVGEDSFTRARVNRQKEKKPACLRPFSPRNCISLGFDRTLSAAPA